MLAWSPRTSRASAFWRRLSSSWPWLPSRCSSSEGGRTLPATPASKASRSSAGPAGRSGVTRRRLLASPPSAGREAPAANRRGGACCACRRLAITWLCCSQWFQVPVGPASAGRGAATKPHAGRPASPGIAAQWILTQVLDSRNAGAAAELRFLKRAKPAVPEQCHSAAASLTHATRMEKQHAETNPT